MLKQKLFDYVSQCAERQDRLSSLKWVLKNKGEKVRARLVVRQIKKAKLEDEKLETCDLFSAMPPLEFESVGQSRDDRTSWPTWTKFGACSVRRDKSTLLRCA